VTSIRADAIAGVYDRISTAPEVIAITGVKGSGRARVYPGTTPPELDVTDCPRIGYLASDVPDGGGRMTLSVQIDLATAPRDAEQGELLDATIFALLDEQHWTFRGARLYALAMSGRAIPTSPGRPLRWTRDYRLFASPV
jgi:hypothetical protein